MLAFYGKEVLALCPIPTLEDHLLLAVHYCLFNIFAATLHIWRYIFNEIVENISVYISIVISSVLLALTTNMNQK